MEAFEKTRTVEDLFKELDDHKFSHIAKPLAALRGELMKEGFTRRESMRLVESYSKFLYDAALEDIIADRRREDFEAMSEADEEESNNVDDDLPEEYS